MRTYIVEIDGCSLTVERDVDGKFIIPEGWRGVGTALKPATEIICLARNPLSEKTVAANVLRWGTGALNIDGCRIEGKARLYGNPSFTDGYNLHKRADDWRPNNSGRWPANVCHDGSAEVLAGFPSSESTRSVITSKSGSVYGNGVGLPSHTGEYGFNDSGSAARFFYTAKADSDDRLGSRHPTVKPVDLIQWLCRLITPPGGTVLDCFAGSGTTGETAIREGFRAVLIEREEAYCADIRRRMKLAMAGPDERQRESIKARGHVQSPGPLFGEQ